MQLGQGTNGTYKGTPNRQSMDFSEESLQTEGME